MTKTLSSDPTRPRSVHRREYNRDQGPERQRVRQLWIYPIDSLDWLPTDGRILQTDHDVKRESQESCRLDITSTLDRHGTMKPPYNKNDHENTDDRRHLVAGALHSLANHRHTALHCHRYR
jgi:hypothetical protein